MVEYAVTDPASGQVLREFPTLSAADVEAQVARSAEAATHMRSLAFDTRAAVLRDIADVHLQRREELAAIATREMGKPTQQALAEIDVVSTIYRWYADESAAHLADDILEPAAGGRAFVRKLPLGPILGIMPWNFPYYQVARFAAPNLAIGNTVLLKPAPSCPESAHVQAEIIRACLAQRSAPADAYLNLFATNEQISTIVADPRVQGVSLTGSERAGAAVAAHAGANLKRVVLELGGSDPFIVLDTTDMDAVVAQAVGARLYNAGQACNASKRFIIADELYDEFVTKFTTAMQAVTPSPPTEPESRLGPLASEAATALLDAQVQRAVADGATLLCGGRRATDGACYYLPTVITDVTSEMAVFTEELFGPVATVLRARNDAEVVALANGTPYGLGASIYTDDVEHAVALSARIDCGMVYVNEPGGTAAELPFGGVKRSGFGRELGKYGLAAFVNEQLVRIAA